MLIPLTRQTFETLIPTVATGAQYLYCWGKFADFLRRLLISVVGAVIVLLGIGRLLPYGSALPLLVGIIVGVYWLWSPAVRASLRNLEYRRLPYTGFWRGEVLDVYVSDELVGKEETVNNRGDLVVVENRERCLNLEVGDETGFSTWLRVPLKRSHQAIRIGDSAEMVVLSNRGDLSRIVKISDIYIPDYNVWVSDYPYLQHEAFVEVSRRLEERDRAEQEGRTRRKRTPRTNRDRVEELAEPKPRRANSLNVSNRTPRTQSSRRPSSSRRTSSRRQSVDWE